MNKLTEVSVKNGYRATCNHYRKLAYPLFLTLLVLLLTSPVQAKYSGVGNGEPNNPYLIADANDMNEIGTHPEDWGSHFLLVNDINLAQFTGTQFNIIGTYPSDPFTGVFDGNDHTIANFSYNSSSTNFVGLFGCVNDPNAEIKDLTLINFNVNAGTGAFVGTLVGYLINGTITGCYAEDVNVSGSQLVGGLIGDSDGTEGTISYCYATGSVVGDGNTVGGLIGRTGVGAGSTAKPITYCFAACSVVGNRNVGGLVGRNGFFNNLWGGLISNCYATGSIDGNDNVGGLAGYNFLGTITNCYSAGKVDGNDPNVGGLVGYHFNGSYKKCFWDSDVNPDVNGIGNTAGDANVIGESTANMQTKSTFTDAGWDFVGEVINGPNDIWRMCVDDVNYPLLSWQFNEVDFTCPDGVDLLDFSVLGLAWGSEQGDGNWNKACDISDPNDDVINIKDLKIFTDNWLADVE